MKLGKEEIQRLALGLLILLGVVYCYFSMLLFPEMAKQVEIRKNIAARGPAIADAKAQIKKTKDLEADAKIKTTVVPQVRAMIPDGSPVAWFPTRLTDFFKRQKIDKIATKLNVEAPEKELPGFRRISWMTDLPKVDFVQFGNALCALENEEPLIEVTSVQVEAIREEAEFQHVLLTLNNLTKQ